MNLNNYKIGRLAVILLSINYVATYGADNSIAPAPVFSIGACILIALVIFLLLLLLFWLIRLAKSLRQDTTEVDYSAEHWLQNEVNNLDAEELELLISRRKKIKGNSGTSHKSSGKGAILTIFFLVFSVLAAQAQDADNGGDVMKSPGMFIMLALILIPLVATVYFIGLRLSNIARRTRYAKIKKDTLALTNAVDSQSITVDDLISRKKALDFKLNDDELAGTLLPDDKRALLRNIAEVESPRFFASKRKAANKHQIDPELIKLIMWYLGTATFWLVTGTSIGEYLGIKFVSPDVDHISWLSFGRLRPVHVNMVFWGWSSLAMIGLGCYVVSTVSNTPLYSIKKGYQSLVLINTAVIAGSLCLMAGINNAGGEYREYIWPVMGIFALGIVITLVNYIQTIAQRKTKEIYISNWYIVSAVMFLTVIATVGYIPWWQNGLGETIIQGYYMHQAVGMWFMLFNLGLVYYFLPQQLNTPIYSYSLGILAFWSQILFYTLIGTHHFIFSSIPWWLQTVAIVGSMGMLIPVFSGTTNFLMTFRGSYHKIGRSYTLPFYLVGILFYFTGSTQGTAEAFRSTNLVWHFTDFTVAHSHLTMYGIIAFMLWGCIYTLIPRLTGREPKQGLVGAHFWMALIGVLLYTIPLMVGGTLKGMAWQAGKPFIDGVVLMAPYWLWRAIGGSLMWASHIIFAWNLYSMTTGGLEADIKKRVFEQLNPPSVKPQTELSNGNL